MTLGEMLDRAAKNFPKKNAIIYKDLKIRFEELNELVNRLANGLIELGIQKGDVVCFIGDNRPEYIWGMLAVQALGGRVVGIYQDSLVEEVEYIVNNADAKMAIVEDQEQTDKMLWVKDKEQFEFIRFVSFESYSDCSIFFTLHLCFKGEGLKMNSSSFFQKGV